VSVARWQVPVKVLNLFCQDKTLLTRRDGLSLTDSNICANGPAVEGVNVGGAVSRYESRYFSRKVVPAGKPPWRNFC